MASAPLGFGAVHNWDDERAVEGIGPVAGELLTVPARLPKAFHLEVLVNGQWVLSHGIASNYQRLARIPVDRESQGSHHPASDLGQRRQSGFPPLPQTVGPGTSRRVAPG